MQQIDASAQKWKPDLSLEWKNEKFLEYFRTLFKNGLAIDNLINFSLQNLAFRMFLMFKAIYLRVFAYLFLYMHVDT